MAAIGRTASTFSSALIHEHLVVDIPLGALQVLAFLISHLHNKTGSGGVMG